MYSLDQFFLIGECVELCIVVYIDMTVQEDYRGYVLERGKVQHPLRDELCKIGRDWRGEILISLKFLVSENKQERS